MAALEQSQSEDTKIVQELHSTGDAMIAYRDNLNRQKSAYLARLQHIEAVLNGGRGRRSVGDVVDGGGARIMPEVKVEDIEAGGGDSLPLGANTDE